MMVLQVMKGQGELKMKSMNDVKRLMQNLFWSIIMLLAASVIADYSRTLHLDMESLLTKKEGIISCGYNQSINDNTVSYSLNWNDPFRKRSLITSMIPEEDHSKSNGNGNGCSHQPSLGALLNGSVGPNRKLQKACTVS